MPKCLSKFVCVNSFACQREHTCISACICSTEDYFHPVFFFISLMLWKSLLVSNSTFQDRQHPALLIFWMLPLSVGRV